MLDAFDALFIQNEHDDHQYDDPGHYRSSPNECLFVYFIFAFVL
jgi:hypothetical protein